MRANRCREMDIDSDRRVVTGPGLTSPGSPCTQRPPTRNRVGGRTGLVTGYGPINVTVAKSVSVSVLPSSSEAFAVTVLVCTSPAFPLSVLVKPHV
jgi:hypothetical protein